MRTGSGSIFQEIAAQLTLLRRSGLLMGTVSSVTSEIFAITNQTLVPDISSQLSFVRVNRNDKWSAS